MPKNRGGGAADIVFFPWNKLHAYFVGLKTDSRFTESRSTFELETSQIYFIITILYIYYNLIKSVFPVGLPRLPRFRNRSDERHNFFSFQCTTKRSNFTFGNSINPVADVSDIPPIDSTTNPPPVFFVTFPKRSAKSPDRPIFVTVPNSRPLNVFKQEIITPYNI